MTRLFWPVGESAQADYETLREAVLRGEPLRTLAAARFMRRGLAGLIAWPGAEPVYVATVQGAGRAPWTPHADPRLDALAAGYELILILRAEHREARTAQRRESRSMQGSRPTPRKRAAPSARNSRCCVSGWPREGHELVAEYTDEGLSGARLDRPGLDALRDAAEAGHIEGVWCLSADRLARMYAYQVIVLDELSRHGVTVRFHDTPRIEDDPQARLLTQVQGVIAEYERAKIAERYRRGKLWRARAGEVIAWKVPYGYRRMPRVGERPAYLEVFEHEAGVVRRIFDDYVRRDISMRQIAKGLNLDGIRSPTGRAVWSVSTIGRILRNEAYIGRVYYNRTEKVPQRQRAGKTRQVQRPRGQWIAIAVPAILDETLFEVAQRVSRDNSRWNPRRAEPGHWLLRGLVKCGHCGVGVSCHKMRGRNGTFHRYYYCHNHDPLRAGGEHRRCPERNIRADELDTFVFERVRDTLLHPQVLLVGEHTVSARREPVVDELLQAQLAKLQRKSDAVTAERRRLADLYQAALIDRDELLRRSKEVQDRKQSVEQQCDALIAQRKELAQQNALCERIIGFSATVGATIDHLDFEQRQKLLRLVVEQVLVRGWRVDIKLRIPLDQPPNPRDPTPSSKDRLRSLDIQDMDVMGDAVEQGAGEALAGELLTRLVMAQTLVDNRQTNRRIELHAVHLPPLATTDKGP